MSDPLIPGIPDARAREIVRKYFRPDQLFTHFDGTDAHEELELCAQAGFLAYALSVVYVPPKAVAYEIAAKGRVLYERITNDG